MCTVSACPATLVAVSGDPTPLGTTVECVSSTNTTGSSTGTAAARVCATEIESDFAATIKTVASASSASNAAAALSTEADEIAVYSAATETLLQQYSAEANGLLTTLASVLEARNSSPEEVESANQQLQALVDAVDNEAAAAVADKTKAEADKVAVAASAAESESWNQRTIASDAFIDRLNADILVFEQQLEAEEDQFGLGAFIIAEQISALIDLRENEIFFLQDHAHEAGVNSRQARSTVRESRVLYTASIERRSNGELKLQQSRDFVDVLTP